MNALVLDVDGTIVGARGTLIPVIKTALEMVWDRLAVILASGRPASGVRYIQSQLGRDGAFIALNGAVLGDAHGRVTAASQELPKAVVAAIRDVRMNFGESVCGVFAYSSERWLAEGTRPAIRTEALATRSEPEVCVDERVVLGFPSIKMTVICRDEGTRDRFCRQLRRRVGHSCEIEGSKAGYVEITRAGVSKGKALVSLIRREGWERVVSVGDGANDVSMFKVSSASYAMPWASAEAKLAAGKVIARPGHSSLARLIIACVEVTGRNGARSEIRSLGGRGRGR